MALEGLLWDFDGLILDTETGAYESARAVFVAHGLELEWWQSIIGTADHIDWFDVLQAQVEQELDRAEIRARRTAHKLELLLTEVVRPGVEHLLDQAAAARIPSAVASSSPFSWVNDNLERIGIAHRYEHIITRDDVDGDPTRTKPAPDLYLLAAERLGVDIAKCVAIEDSPNGVLAAKAAGARCVAVPAGMTATLAFDHADVIVPTLLDLSLEQLQTLTG